MKRAGWVLLLGLVFVFALGASRPVPRNVNDDDDDGDRATLKATLRGFEEPPAVSSVARGEFRATFGDDGASFTYRLTYSGLEGAVLQSHIHLGQRGVNGGIAVFLCTNLGNGPAGTPLCPGPDAGTVEGEITGASIVGPSGQGLAPGEFAELLRAIDRQVTYVNVHSSKFPGGEIRGQIQSDQD